MIQEHIKELLAKRGMHTLDIYKRLNNRISLQGLELILNNGLEKGEWKVADGYWTLENRQPEPTASALETEVDYLVNESRRFIHPSQKKGLTREYYLHEHYTPYRTTLSEMFSKNIDGFQIVPGKFERNQDGDVKRKSCWQLQQVFMVEFDENVTYTNLSDVVTDNPFIRENACALVESIRSCYNDPSDDTCNGDLRYRAFFCMPNPVVNIEPAEFLISQLLKELPDACPTGSNLTNGAFGLENANAIYLGNFVSDAVVSRWTQAWETKQTEKMRYSVSDAVNIKELAPEYADAVNSLTYESDGWSQEALPCNHRNHEHDSWGGRQNAMFVYQHTDGMGFTFFCHKCPAGSQKRSYRIKPNKRQGRSRVKQTGDSEVVYETLSNAEIHNQGFWDYICDDGIFGRERRAIHISTDTGVGKDFAMLVEAKHNDMMSLNPHGGLTEQLHHRSLERGLESYHIRSRLHGFSLIEDLSIPERIKVFKQNKDVLCIHADRCQALLDKTDTCKETLCNSEHCEVYDFCAEHRYVSQIQKAAQAQIAHYSWPQLPTDPGSAGIVAQIMKARAKYSRGPLTWVVGEVDAHKMLNRHIIPVSEIQKGIAAWRDEPAGQLYRLLGLLCNETLSPQQRWDQILSDFSGIDYSVASRQLSRVPVWVDDKLNEMKLLDALKYEVLKADNAIEIEKWPRLYANHWTLMQRFEQFLMYCANPEPPIHFGGTHLEFITPPDLHSMVDTYVMQSATANSHQLKTLITMTDPQIEFYTAETARVEHHEDARIYKVATGRYVRGTFFEREKDLKITGIKETALPHFENLLNILQNTPGPKWVNTYKPIYEGDELAHEPVIMKLRLLSDVQWSNWAAGFGLDLDPETVVIEFGTNEPSEQMLKETCSEIYFSSETPLDFSFSDGSENNGIHIAGVRTYTDARVQAQYEQMVSLAQYQMANRTRPVRNASLVLIYSCHPCEWLDNRVEWVMPSMLGGNLREFEIPEPETQFQREKSEKKSLAIELAKEGIPNKDIAIQLGYKSESSITNLLKGVDLT